MAAPLRNTSTKIAGRSRSIPPLHATFGVKGIPTAHIVPSTVSFHPNNTNTYPQCPLQTRVVRDRCPPRSWFSRTDEKWMVESQHKQQHAEDPNKAKLGKSESIYHFLFIYLSPHPLSSPNNLSGLDVQCLSLSELHG